MNRLFLLSFLVCVLGTGVLSTRAYAREGAETAPAAEDRLPDNWRVDDIVRAVVQDQVAVESHVLVWEIRQDRRPFRVETAIVWVHTKDEGKDRWTLDLLFCHPLDRNQVRKANPIWHGAPRVNVRGTTRRKFDHPPQDDEIRRYLQIVGWKFAPRTGPDFTLIDGGVCAGAWKKVTGKEPPQLLPDGK
jgi:hypothetical protein